MKEEAAANADADKREKERIEKLNQADSLIFQTEKQLTELGDKIPSDKKSQIESALTKLKEAHKSQDLTGIESATAELTTVFHAATQDLYGKGGAPFGGADPFGANGPFANTQQPPTTGGTTGKDGVTDADFEEVK
jgi:molecular chaperone DnaK